MISCTQCGHKWSGLAQAHCKSCHEHFNSVSAFDRHRVRFECCHPESVGMVKSSKGAWIEKAHSRVDHWTQTAA
jgi:hypothetical protein